MKILFCLAITLATPNTFADEAADRSFARKFISYRLKNKVSALRTAEAFAKQTKKTPEQILKRFVTVQFSLDKHADLAVVYGLEAFQDLGHSYDSALAQVSDLTGQMTSTVNSMNENSRFNARRSTASRSARLDP